MDNQTIIERINLGHASAYAYYKAGGGTATEEEFTQLIADLGIQVENLENMVVVTNTLDPDSQASATYEDGVLTLNIPKGEKGDPAPQEEITTATDAWLEANITNPSNPPLDRSLSLANAAAPADMVGDLKSAVDELYDIEVFDYSGVSTGRWLITSNNEWSLQSSSTQAASYSIAIPSNVKFINVKSVGHGGVIAFLSSMERSQGSTPFYSSGTGRIALSSGDDITYKINEDMLYLYATLSTTSGADLTPTVTLYSLGEEEEAPSIVSPCVFDLEKIFTIDSFDSSATNGRVFHVSKNVITVTYSSDSTNAKGVVITGSPRSLTSTLANYSPQINDLIPISYLPKKGSMEMVAYPYLESSYAIGFALYPVVVENDVITETLPYIPIMQDGNMLRSKDFDFSDTTATHFSIIYYTKNSSDTLPTTAVIGINPSNFIATGTDTTVEEIVDSMKYIKDMPENNGQANVLKRAAQVRDIEYVTTAILPYYGDVDQAAGKTIKGIPYSSVRPEGLYVPNSVSLHTFMTASKNPNSYLYTKKLAIPNYNGRTYYGSVCSSYIAWCYGIDNVIPTTGSFSTYEGFTKLPSNQQNVQSLKLGDMLLNANSHAVIVTGIYRSIYGNICYVEISESTASARKVRMMKYTAQEVMSTYFDKGFRLYRYDNISSVPYTASPWIHLDLTEDTTPEYCENIIPRRGDRANWPAGSDIEFDIINQDSYTQYEYENIDTSEVESGDISGSLISLTSIPAGRYKLRLKVGTNYSGYVYFDVINTQGTIFEVQSGRKVKVTPNTSLGVPSSVCFCSNVIGSSGREAVYSFYVLTSEDIENGYAIVDSPSDESVPEAENSWLMKVMYKTEFGLYSGQLTEVNVATIGTVTESAYTESDFIVDVS